MGPWFCPTKIEPIRELNHYQDNFIIDFPPFKYLENWSTGSLLSAVAEECPVARRESNGLWKKWIHTVCCAYSILAFDRRGHVPRRQLVPHTRYPFILTVESRSRQERGDR